MAGKRKDVAFSSRYLAFAKRQPFRHRRGLQLTVSWVGIGRTCSDPSSAHPVVVACSIGFDDDIVTLSHADHNTVSGVWNKRYEIHPDNCERVSVDVELEVSIRRTVDESDSVLLPGLENSLEFLAATHTVGVR